MVRPYSNLRVTIESTDENCYILGLEYAANKHKSVVEMVESAGGKLCTRAHLKDLVQA